jgi:hypothetical protein
MTDIKKLWRRSPLLTDREPLTQNINSSSIQRMAVRDHVESTFTIAGIRNRVLVHYDLTYRDPVAVYATAIYFAPMEGRTVPGDVRADAKYSGFYFRLKTVDLIRVFKLVNEESGQLGNYNAALGRRLQFLVLSRNRSRINLIAASSLRN